MKNLIKKLRQIYNPSFWILKELIQKLSKFIDGQVVLKFNDFDGKFFIDVRSDIFFRLIHKGEYEKNLAKLIDEHIDINLDVVDVGSDIGLITVKCAKKIGAQRKVLSIEPSQRIFNFLKKNLELNGISKRVITENYAVSDKEEKIRFHTIEGKEEYSSVYEIEHPSVKNEKKYFEEVNSKKLDNLIFSHEIQPGLIKIDIEGAEYLALRGCIETIKSFSPVFFIEINIQKNSQDSLKNAKKIFNFFKEFHSECFDMIKKPVLDISEISSGNFIFLKK